MIRMEASSPYVRFAAAFEQGYAETYLKAYVSVMEQLEAERATGLLTSVVNTLLARMRKNRTDVHQEARALIGETTALRSKYFVMAAAVDIALNARRAGDRIDAVAPMAETLNRPLPAQTGLGRG